VTYLDALQDTLAAEQAAVFVIGYLGAQTSQSAEPELAALLRDAYGAHRARRDDLVARVRDVDGEPVAAAASYDIADVQGQPARVRRQALQVERSCAATYGFLVASSPTAERRFAVDTLIEVALREIALGGRPRPLPGR
jgi:hypothetical protein